MLRWLSNYSKSVPPVFIDGTLYVLIAVFGTVQSMFTTEEAYKYVPPYVLFWGKSVLGTMLAAVSALKMFRSTSFAEHLETKATETEKPK